jgi:hypothetical protein
MCAVTPEFQLLVARKCEDLDFADFERLGATFREPVSQALSRLGRSRRVRNTYLEVRQFSVLLSPGDRVRVHRYLGRMADLVSRFAVKRKVEQSLRAHLERFGIGLTEVSTEPTQHARSRKRSSMLKT